MKYAAELRDEAKALYLQLGLERSVDAVRQALLERGLDVPSERELYRWKKEDAWDEALDELRALAARKRLAEVETLREEAARRHLQLGKLAQTRGGLRLAKAAPAELTIAEAQRLIDQGIRWESAGLEELGATVEAEALLRALALERDVDPEALIELLRAKPVDRESS